ncbi:DNA-binding protein [Candidatus Woesearchaeota archaeon]|nr:MAG: DNA-binding protein [Candidatus Woesearchaeota archaeon]
MNGKKVSPKLWMLRIDAGDKLPDSIIGFCRKNGIKTARVEGIGALRNVVLGFYSLERKQYFQHEYPEHHELLLLKGNVTLKEGKPFLHAHAIIGKPNNACFGGHLVRGEVSATLEVFIEETEKPVERKSEKKTGLHVWKV